MSLADWERNGWLTAHRTSRNEIRDLLDVVERDLADQSLRETIGADATLVNTLEAFRKKRNVTGYERVGLVSDADAESMRALAVQLRDGVAIWLRTYHPHLIAK